MSPSLLRLATNSVLPFGLLLVFACSSSSPTAGVPDGAAMADAGSPDGGTTDSGSADTGSIDSQDHSETSISCMPPDGGPACNPLATAAPSVAVTCGAEPPEMLGGSISDGTYVLASETRYHCPDGGLGSLPSTDAATITISGSCLEGIAAESGQTFTYAATLEPHGDALTMTSLCSSLIGGFSTTSATFTATGTTLSFLFSYSFPELQVYTRQ